nr:MAG: hypothetical protein [Microviridae sp.]
MTGALSPQTETAQIEGVKIRTTFITQSGNEILGVPDKLLYYLIIESPKGKKVVNVGQKTYDEVFKLIS